VALNAARRGGVAVFNAPFSNTRSVAELTIAEIVVLHRRLLERSNDLHDGRWRKSAQGAHEIRGRTLGIVGYGHIGSQLSVLAEAMGMRVLYFDVAPKMSIGNARASESLKALLSECDVVSLHVPDTPATQGLFGAVEFAHMRAGSIFINNARGTVVDLDALAAALKSGHLAGAAVDVFMGEPRSNDEAFSTPLAGLPNVILTPHIGGSTREAQHAIAEDTARKLRTYILEGSTLASVSVPQVDLPSPRPNQSRILHFHRNVPGVLGRLHTMLAELNVNINAEFLQSDLETSYVILDVDPGHDDAVKAGLHAIEETIRLRTLF
jgi:D-3-phosphoglycerate dehydrogenase